MDELSDLVKGQIVAGRYEIERLVGEGGMGTVYLARDRNLSGRRVALKALHERFVGRKGREQRFLNEAHFSALTGRLPYHTNIAATLDRGRIHGERPFIVMEYVDGPAICGLSVVEGRPLSADEVCGLARGLASAMQTLHEAGLVHRDLTPMNVLVATVGEEWIPKVIDLSHAASISGPKLQLGHPDRLTQPHEAPGTPGYMAPEQVAGAYPSPSMDVFSFGVTLWELLADRHAYRERERSQYFVLQRETPRPPPALQEYRPDLPTALCRLIEACTHVDPSQRPTPQRILEWLDAARFELQIQHEPEPEPRLTELPQLDTKPQADREPSRRSQAREAPRARGGASSQTQEPSRSTQGLSVEAPRDRRRAVMVILISLLVIAVVIGWILLMKEGEPGESDDPRPVQDEVASAPQGSDGSWEDARAPQPVSPHVPGGEEASDEPPVETPESIEPAPEVQPPEVQPEAEPPPDEERPRSQRRRKPRRQPTPAVTEPDCTNITDDAEQARRSRKWKRVLKLTKDRRCWDDESARVWARVRALLELGRYAECAALASSSKSPDVARMATICVEKNTESNEP